MATNNNKPSLREIQEASWQRYMAQQQTSSAPPTVQSRPNFGFGGTASSNAFARGFSTAPSTVPSNSNTTKKRSPSVKLPRPSVKVPPPDPELVQLARSMQEPPQANTAVLAAAPEERHQEPAAQHQAAAPVERPAEQTVPPAPQQPNAPAASEIQDPAAGEMQGIRTVPPAPPHQPNAPVAGEIKGGSVMALLYLVSTACVQASTACVQVSTACVQVITSRASQKQAHAPAGAEPKEKEADSSKQKRRTVANPTASNWPAIMPIVVVILFVVLQHECQKPHRATSNTLCPAVQSFLPITLFRTADSSSSQNGNADSSNSEDDNDTRARQCNRMEEFLQRYIPSKDMDLPSNYRPCSIPLVHAMKRHIISLNEKIAATQESLATTENCTADLSTCKEKMEATQAALTVCRTSTTEKCTADLTNCTLAKKTLADELKESVADGKRTSAQYDECKKEHNKAKQEADICKESLKDEKAKKSAGASCDAGGGGQVWSDELSAFLQNPWAMACAALWTGTITCTGGVLIGVLYLTP